MTGSRKISIVNLQHRWSGTCREIGTALTKSIFHCNHVEAARIDRYHTIAICRHIRTAPSNHIVPSIVG
jgi:hypothetical protein